MQEILTQVTPYIAGGTAAFVTAFIGFFVGRRKTKADAVAVELANVEKAISIYRTITEDLQSEIKLLKLELEKLYLQNKQLIEENKTLKIKMQQLEKKLDNI